MPPSIVSVDQNGALFEAAQSTLEKRAPVDLFPHDQFGSSSREPAVIVRLPQRPVQPGRRNLECVCAWNEILDVEDGTQLSTDRGTIFHADAVLCRRGRSRMVDSHPEHHPACLATELHIEDLQTMARRNPARQLADARDEV